MHRPTMSGTTTAHTHTATAHTHHDNAPSPLDSSPIAGTLVRLAERFGVPVVILLLVLWWARNDVVQPLLDAHFGFIEKIVEGQQRHTTAQGMAGDLNQGEAANVAGCNCPLVRSPC